MLQRDRIRVVFDPSIPMRQVRGTLKLSRLATESLHGPRRVQLEGRAGVDRKRHSVVIGTASAVGRTLALIFLGYVRREFGDESVRVLRRKARETVGDHR